MEYGLNYLKCALNSGDFVVGKVKDNAVKMINIAKKSTAAIICFPELSLTGYSLGEFIQSREIWDETVTSLGDITKASNEIDSIMIIGAPYLFENNLYNCAYVIYHGEILGIVPKSNLPISKEFNENRYFNTLSVGVYHQVQIGEYDTIFGQMVFKNHDGLCFGVEICADIWAIDSPHRLLALNGAQVIFNLSASTYNIQKREDRKALIKAISLKNQCAYLYVSSNSSESTSSCAFDSCQIAYLDGRELETKQNLIGGNQEVLVDVDLQAITYKRMNIGYSRTNDDFLPISEFDLSENDSYRFETKPDPNPFVKEAKGSEEEIIDTIAKTLSIKMKGLEINDCVLGLSGGIDSALTLVIGVKALEYLGLSSQNLHAYLLPMAHSSQKSIELAKKLGEMYQVDLKTIDIDEAVHHQLQLINHNGKEDVTFENAQARYRTYTLLNIANQKNALMLGTGDMSESALGFCTFGGDHLAHINVIAGLPKTVVKHLMLWLAKQAKGNDKALFVEIASKKYSPELVSGDQFSEDFVGSYELNDFIMYELIGKMSSVKRVVALLKVVYPTVDGLKAVKNFVGRFEKSQFKRNTAPETIKIFDLSIDKRDFIEPNDLKLFDIEA